MLVDRLRSLLSGLPVRILPSSAAEKAAVRVGGGTAIAQALAVLTAPVLTRLYSPAEMGQFAVLLSFVSFAMVGVAWRYDMAIVPAHSDEEANELALLSAGLTVPTSALFAVLLMALVATNSMAFGSLSRSSVAAALVILVAAGLFSALRYWAIRRNAFGAIGRAAIAQGAGRAAVPIATGLFGAGTWGLVLGEVAGRTMGAGDLLRLAAGPMRETIRQSSIASLWRTARANWRYPLIVAPSSWLDALGGALPLPLVAAVFGDSTAGQLAIVQRLGGVPAALIGASVADVFHAKLSVLFRENPGDMRRAVLRTTSRLALIACAVYIPIGVMSPLVFGWVFGQQWKDAGLLVALFTPLSIATLAVGPVTRLYSVVHRPELKLWFDVAQIAVPIVSFSILGRTQLGLWKCMAVYVALSTAAFAFQLGLTLWAAGLPARERAGGGETGV